MDDLKDLLANMLAAVGFGSTGNTDSYSGIYWRRIVTAMAFTEDTLRGQLQHIGLSYSTQTTLLVAATFALAFAVFRAVSGKGGLVLALILAAFGFHLLLPALGS